MRPAPFQLELPSEQFLWKGFDDSTIKATRVYCYNTALGNAKKEIEERIDMQKDYEVALVNWGVGNHGGGPSRKDLQNIKELIDSSSCEIIHSYPENYFKEINPTKVFDKSLHISMPGCYVSMSKVKRKHIALENEIYFLEKICSVASLMGLMTYPQDKINQITEDLLNSEFHDTLPGTCIQIGEENALNYLGHGILEAEKLKTHAFFALSKTLSSAKEGEYPIVVFNPSSFEEETNIECEISRADYSWDDTIKTLIDVYDETGVKLDSQIIKEDSNQNFEWRKRVIFKAKLKPMSLNRFGFFPKYEKKSLEEKDIIYPFDKIPKEDFVFDNGRKYVEIDKNTGLLKKYSVNGVDLI
ncbi:MAG: hypothetical protein KBS91_02605, partial [Firmicutes bacterium]|nr:hypothetical protein [Candidatus Caballimonas caccae]